MNFNRVNFGYEFNFKYNQILNFNYFNNILFFNSIIRIFLKIFLIIILLTLFLKPVFSYDDSLNIFKGEIYSITFDENYTFTIGLNLENRVDSNIDYDVEIIYLDENDELISSSFSCDSHCLKYFTLSKTYFGLHRIYINAFYDGNLYSQELDFNLADKLHYKYSIDLNKKYFIERGRVNIFGNISSEFDRELKYDFEIYPKTNPSDKYYFSKFCSKSCSFNFKLKNNILLDEYIVNIYSPLGDMQKKIGIGLDVDSALDKLGLKNNKNENCFNCSINCSCNKNNSIKELNVNGNNYNNYNNYNNSSNYNNFNKSSKYNLNNSNNIFTKEFESELSKNSTNKTLIEKIKPIINNNFESKNQVNLEVDNSNISLENLSLISREEKKFIFFVEEEHIDGSKSMEMIIGDEAKNYEPDEDIVSINSYSNDLRGIELTPRIKSFNISNYGVTSDVINGRISDSSYEDIKKELENLERINYSNKRYDLVSNLSLNMGSHPSIKPNALVPGIYKKKSILFGDEYYAIGLISINTLKPLYHSGEIIMFKIVVLDKEGYPYNTHNLILNVKRPDGNFEVLSMKNKSILASPKTGVYYGFINGSLIGKYDLFAQAKVDNLIVEVTSYINVVEEYPFDIIRNVPVTIDPWQGPFYNNFSIKSYIGEDVIFNLTEIIPYDFFVFENNADILEEDGDFIKLKWLNINSSFIPFYRANSPLISPYLYELGRTKIEYNYLNKKSLFYENRSWLFAIDPLLIDTNQWTCSNTFGFQCSDWPSDSEGDNTFDTCPNSKGGDGDEYVVEVTLNQTTGLPNSNISVTCRFDPYSNGDEEYVYYYDGNTWIQLYADSSPSGDVHDVTINLTLNSNPGIHWFRCIIDWDGEDDECADGGNWYDNDDASLNVINPFLSLISPENKSYSSGSVNTIIETSLNANISYNIDDNGFEEACYNCTNFSTREFYTKGSHNILVQAIDVNTGEINLWEEYFYVETSEVNPSINTSDRTCSITFDTDCSLWPSDNETDNTFDSCPTSLGGDGDEYVIEAILNQSNAYTNDSINVTCVFNPYSDGDEEYIYYYNTTNWIQLYSGSSPSSDVHNVSAVVRLSNISGTHWFRCIIDWDGENDECADGGNYYDNDDVSLDVYEYIENPPFIVSLNSPKNTSYINTTIYLDFAISRNSSIEYSVDDESFIQVCDNCTNYIGTRDLRVGSHFLNLRGYDDINSIYVYENVTFTINATEVSAINTSDRTCSITFDTDCSLWPSSDEEDNTFDTCPKSNGGDGDEYVIEAIINSSVSNVKTDVNITCVFNPYSNGDEEYIYYYNSTDWTQLYSGTAPGSDVHNVSVIVNLDNTSDETTHWFRCIIDWDGEDDECADEGSYYDNDDVSIQVIRPVIITFDLTIYSPLNTTYTSEYIDYDFETTKNATIKYKFNSDDEWITACDNCTNFTYQDTLSENNYTLEVLANDSETGEEIYKNVSFTIKIPKNDNILFRLPTPVDGYEQLDTSLFVNTSIYAENSTRFNLSDGSNSSVYLLFDSDSFNMSCNGTNPDYVCDYLVTNILEGNHDYQACMKDNYGNVTCTEVRTIIIYSLNKEIYLGLKKLINRVTDNLFNFDLSLYNLNNRTTIPNRNLFFYSFIPDYFNISSFSFTNSTYYNVSLSNESLNSDGINGTIYKFELFPNNLDNSTFNLNNGSLNINNSFNVSFNSTGLNEYDLNKIIFGFE